MERRFFSGTTVEQAVMKAARHFEIEPEELAYRQRDKKHGFLKVRRSVVIEVDPSSPRLSKAEDPRPQREPAKPAAIPEPEEAFEATTADEGVTGGDFDDEESLDDDLDDEDFEDEEFDDEDDDGEDDDEEDDDEEPEDDDLEIEDEIDAIHEAVRELADFMRLDVEWTVYQEEDEVYWIDITGHDADLLIDEEGHLLGAIEHLVPRLVRGYIGHGIACKVDSDGFLEEHEEKLRQLALDAAEEARETGRPEVLDPMNPSDRRIVHITLADEPDLETESEGDGFFKRVRVIPVD